MKYLDATLCPFCGGPFINERELMFHLSFPEPGCENSGGSADPGNRTVEVLVDLSKNRKEYEMDQERPLAPSDVHEGVRRLHEQQGDQLAVVEEEILQLEIRLASKQALRDTLVRSREALGEFLWPEQTANIDVPEGGGYRG